MLPAFKQGDRVIASKLSYLFSTPKIGDVVVFKIKNDNNKNDRYDTRVYIKRIIGINCNKNNIMFLVAGDNKRDSKKIEPLQKNDIIGKVMMKYG